MKTSIRTLFCLLLIVFLAIGAVPWITSVSPQMALAQTASPSALPLPPTEPTTAPVVFEGETLFVVRSRLGSLSPQERSQRTTMRIVEFADDYSLSPEDLEVMSIEEEGAKLTGVTAGAILLLFVSEQDAKLVGQTRQSLAEQYAQAIQSAVERYRQERSFGHLMRGATSSAIATVILLGLVWLSNRIFARIYQRLRGWGNTYIRAVRVGNVELIPANYLDNVLTLLTRVIQAVIFLSLLALYFPYVFSQFPWTRELGRTFWSYLEGGINAIGQQFVNYLPSLFTIGLVIIITYFLLRLTKPFFHQLSQGILALPGFYPEWSWPTYKLVNFLIIALAAVIIFPLLPGFQSPAFQGISVFLGLLISLGSTSVIANVMSGSVLIYTRAFRVGDRIKIDDIFGQVIETTLLVTRILTPTNVVISIPNSQIITSSIENLNFAPQELNKPLIVRTPIYLGYEVPWREAYAALIQAALQTEGVAQTPPPFVLQGELNEVYVTYQLNVYLDLDYFQGKTVREYEKTQSELNENIRDSCTNAGIRIFAPSYEADPNNYGPAATEEDAN